MITTKIKTNPERIYVDPKFKEILKIESAKKGKSIINFTKSLSKEDMYNIINNHKNKKKNLFDFG